MENNKPSSKAAFIKSLDIKTSLALLVGAIAPFFYFVGWQYSNAYYSSFGSTHTHGDQGLDILDVSEHSNPIIIKKFETAEHVRNLEPRGNITFLANGYNGLKIVDTSDKSSLKTVSQIQTYRALDVDVLGNYAHIADDWAGYKLIDVSDINNPKLVAELDIRGYAEDVFAINKLVFVASGDGGLRIIYLKDGNKPQELSAIELENGYANEVVVKGRYVYLAAGKEGLFVINISNPKSILEVGSYKAKRSAKHLTIDKDLAYLVDLEKLRVLDISNPKKPVSINEHSLPARSAKVHIQEGSIYVAGMESGMVIFDAK